MHYILAVDSSEHSRHAAEWIAANVLRTGDSATALTVLPTPMELTQSMAVGDPMFAPVYLESLVQEAVNAANALLDTTAKALCKDGVAVEKVLLRGEVRDSIVDWAGAARGPAVLVIGTRGMGALKRTFLGSTADYCVHHCGIPVLVVRPTETNRT